MKNFLAVISAILCLCLCACNANDSPGTSENNSNPNQPLGYPFSFDSLADFQNAVNEEENLYAEVSEMKYNQKTKDNFKVFVQKLKAQGIPVPYLNGQVIEFRYKEGHSGISLFPFERYDLPCIFYHPAVATGENLYITFTYLPDSITETQEELTASEVRKILSPNSANIGNLGEQHKSIYEQKIQLADREVTALVFEYKTDNRNSTFFVYDDLLIEVRNNPEVWTDAWFSTLSFASFNG